MLEPRDPPSRPVPMSMSFGSSEGLALARVLQRAYHTRESGKRRARQPWRSDQCRLGHDMMGKRRP